MLKPIRCYHFIDHQSIIHNGVRLNEKIYNAVRISDPDKNGKGQVIPANANIPANYLRLLDVTDQINDPKQNVIDQSHGNTGLIMAYAQSFLREEVGKMYRGEMVLRGIPEIEPADVLLITGSSRPAGQQKPSHARAGCQPGFSAPDLVAHALPSRGDRGSGFVSGGAGEHVPPHLVLILSAHSHPRWRTK